MRNKVLEQKILSYIKTGKYTVRDICDQFGGDSPVRRDLVQQLLTYLYEHEYLETKEELYLKRGRSVFFQEKDLVAEILMMVGNKDYTPQKLIEELCEDHPVDSGRKEKIEKTIDLLYRSGKLEPEYRVYLKRTA